MYGLNKMKPTNPYQFGKAAPLREGATKQQRSQVKEAKANEKKAEIMQELTPRAIWHQQKAAGVSLPKRIMTRVATAYSKHLALKVGLTAVLGGAGIYGAVVGITQLAGIVALHGGLAAFLTTTPAGWAILGVAAGAVAAALVYGGYKLYKRSVEQAKLVRQDAQHDAMLAMLEEGRGPASFAQSPKAQKQSPVPKYEADNINAWAKNVPAGPAILVAERG